LKQVPQARLYPEILDLAEQASIHAFAKRVIERFPEQSLDLLINNAGVMALPKRETTADGFERQFATNYLGPFALTGLLLPSIKAKPGSRVVTLSSGASHQGKIEFDNLQSERAYKPMFQAYAQSKLADLNLFAGIAATVGSRRIADHEHGCSPWIRGDESSGGSRRRKIDVTHGGDETVSLSRCGAWSFTDALCCGGC
jgi:NAD(P)-dependent dehydrogenase (short-subunit alcohol dehydrogenase family)